MEIKGSSSHDSKYFRDGILAGNRMILSQAITLAESSLGGDRSLAERLIESLLPETGKSIRIGITGAPGVGKSTFIEALGTHITSLGKKIAVLTIDPSSQKTKGSILGDKTRMEELARNSLAYIRPSASGIAYGGVTHATGDAVLLCEAAGFEVIIVETVGVGQSEVAVRSLVDFFLLLMLAGSGDELQGIKKGIMEMADGMAITKGDEDNLPAASRAQAEFKSALHLFQVPSSGIVPEVVITSALTHKGIADCWEMISRFIAFTTTSGFFKHQRAKQQIDRFYATLQSAFRSELIARANKDLREAEEKISSGNVTATAAVRTIVEKIFPAGEK